ncbi:hypothetical protein DZD52_08830 [Xanthomonas nasturtii]|uniref:Uncharacterized protein n=1 Tax=Xanthomonas nasturtii TaxID=1843581 RepID=A0A3E1KLJ6_9XANT|nr:hypothetical protein DZD52_08830 [Xanthomonas nasturtii]
MIGQVRDSSLRCERPAGGRTIGRWESRRRLEKRRSRGYGGARACAGSTDTITVARNRASVCLGGI